MTIILDTPTHKIVTSGDIDNTVKPIRTITTGSMQRRFTIPEEVFIESDPSAKVIKSRLLNANYCDLDYQDTIDGVSYICGVLEAGAVIVDAAVRVAELLVDGTELERWP